MPSATFRVAAVTPAERTFRDAQGNAVRTAGVGVRAVPVENGRWADLEGWYADSANGQIGFSYFDPDHAAAFVEGFTFDVLLEMAIGPPGATFVVGGLARVTRGVAGHGWLAARTLDGLKVKGYPVPPKAGGLQGFYPNSPKGDAGFTVFGAAALAFRQGTNFHFLLTPQRS